MTKGIADRGVAKKYYLMLKHSVRLSILGIALMALTATSVYADAKLDVTPQSITTATIEKPAVMNARVRLRAPDDAALRNIRLTSFSNDGISVEVAPDEAAANLDVLAPNDEHLWLVRLTSSRSLAKKAQVIFEVALDEATPDEGSVRRHLYANLEIEPPSPDTLTSLVSMEIKGGDGIVSRQRPGRIHVVLKNQRDLSLQVTELRWFGPGFIELRAAATKCDADADSPAPPLSGSHLLSPYEQVVIPVLVCPNEQIVPGKYNLLATASVASAGTPLSMLTANREVRVGVLGESELLNLLGVPSLLLLPGFLFLITWRILSSLQGATAAGGFELKPKEVDFWAVAIALSLGFAFFYPWLTERILPEGGRDYLVAYGLRDLVYVYTLAIVLGSFGYGCKRLVDMLVTLYKNWQMARYMPLEGDLPVAILEKLALAKGDIELPTLYLQGTQPDLRLFELNPWTTPKLVWLTPPIVLKIKDRFESEDETRRANNALQRVTLSPNLDAAEAGQIVKDGVEKGWWTAEWSEVGAVRGPTSRGADSVVTLHARERLVIESP